VTEQIRTLEVLKAEAIGTNTEIKETESATGSETAKLHRRKPFLDHVFPGEIHSMIWILMT